MTLHVTSSTITNSSYRSNELCGAWGSDSSFTVTGVTVDSPTQLSESFNVDAEVGEVVYVLAVIYGSGDSFGNSSGNGEIIYVFKSARSALKAKLQFEDNENDYLIPIELDSGSIVELWNPGADYFEYIEDVVITAFTVQP